MAALASGTAPPSQQGTQVHFGLRRQPKHIPSPSQGWIGEGVPSAQKVILRIFK